MHRLAEKKRNTTAHGRRHAEIATKYMSQGNAPRTAADAGSAPGSDTLRASADKQVKMTSTDVCMPSERRGDVDYQMFMTHHSLEANAIQLNLVGKRKRPPRCGHHDGFGGIDVKLPIMELVSGLLGSMLEDSFSCCTLVSNNADGSVICELVTRNFAFRNCDG